MAQEGRAAREGARSAGEIAFLIDLQSVTLQHLWPSASCGQNYGLAKKQLTGDRSAMERHKPLLPSTHNAVAEHDKPPTGRRAKTRPGLDQIIGVIAWLRRPTSAGMPVWKYILGVMFGAPLALLIFMAVVGKVLSKQEPTPETKDPHQAASEKTPEPQADIDVVAPGPWLEQLASYLRIGPRRKAPECHQETDHQHCDLSLPGLTLADVGFLHGHKGAWNVTLSPAASSDLRPSRFGQVAKMCDRPGLMGQGATFYQIVGGPLRGNFVTIQYSEKAPTGYQALIKSPEYFRHAPTKYNASWWWTCAKEAGISLEP